MKSYQIIILIGSIIGILVTLGLALTRGMLEQFSSDTYEVNQGISSVYTHTGLAFVVYIVILVIAFTVKSNKAVGITSIISSILVLLLNGIFGIVGFALLLSGGIVALAYTRGEKTSPITNDEG